MKALVTGASSGLGREFAICLDKMGYDIIAVARREEKLQELKGILKNKTEIYVADLSKKEECFKLYSKFPEIDILINNAGFGVFGEFFKTDIEKELSMIDLNICAMHILTKMYLLKFKEKNSGYILNVASSAAFFPGPVFSSYYASKAYVYRLSRAVSYELKKCGSDVSVSVFCPGPVRTEFDSVAGARDGAGALLAKTAAEYAVKKMFKRKLVIVPGFSIKCTRLLSKILPDCIGERLVYRIQKNKE